jgi:hypothetical protein
MKKLALIVAALVSTSAFAANTQVETEAYKTQAQAYDAGFELVEEINTMGYHQLAPLLKVYGVSDNYSVVVNDIEVKVESFAKEKGVIQYRAILDVDFDYDS